MIIVADSTPEGLDIKNALVEWGFEVLSAFQIKDIGRLAADEIPQLFIISSGFCQRINPLHLRRSYCKTHPDRQTPFLFVDNGSKTQELAQAQAEMNVGVLSKPVSREQLKACVKTLLPNFGEHARKNDSGATSCHPSGLKLPQGKLSAINAGSKRFSIQTEVEPLAQPRLVSTIFIGGRILHQEILDYDIDWEWRQGWELVQDVHTRSEELLKSKLRAC